MVQVSKKVVKKSSKKPSKKAKIDKDTHDDNVKTLKLPLVQTKYGTLVDRIVEKQIAAEYKKVISVKASQMVKQELEAVLKKTIKEWLKDNDKEVKKLIANSLLTKVKERVEQLTNSYIKNARLTNKYAY